MSSPKTSWMNYLAPSFVSNAEEKKSPVTTHPAVAMHIGERFTDLEYEGGLINYDERSGDISALARLAFSDMQVDDHDHAARLHHEQYIIFANVDDPHGRFRKRVEAHVQARNFHYLAARRLAGEEPDEGKYLPQ